MTKPKILYIGNKVSIHGKTETTIETLSVLLQKEGFEVISTSSKKNMMIRMMEMIFQILKWKMRLFRKPIGTHEKVVRM